ncbi:ubiquitin carboxyl-terminal hydrolase [bacterium]|jgi:hypothetical protein|nr:ubiquitin carboxyl-terminal hydrolase [bacterium]MBT3903729.1 ubiquitin carboxyl-terminal hydrolase [bacterium]MBT4578039.1 ubiquitin carboxyl-terminal hydrolase [bacterium]MBT5346196.1 ubiquitin carboxyl-terminal hydrolase [bacterium]MBT6130992.1 ubiquitin carboxyl-terminal hydrolase [bacterium]
MKKLILISLFLAATAAYTRIPKGLDGGSNRCYFNATLQSLCNIEQLSDYFINNTGIVNKSINLYKDNDNKNKIVSSKTIVTEFATALSRMRKATKSITISNKFYRNIQDNFIFPKLRRTDIRAYDKQRDATGFTSGLLATLGNNVKSCTAYQPPGYTGVDGPCNIVPGKLFAFSEIYTKIAAEDKTGDKAYKKDDILSIKNDYSDKLSLPIPKQNKPNRLTELLNNYHQEPNETDFTISYRSDGNPIYIKAKTFITLQSTPEILQLMFKRQIYAKDGTITKDNAKISFPQELDLSDFPLTDKNTIGNRNYQLIAIIAQSGSITGGHYIAYTRDVTQTNKNKQWYKCDDSIITQLNNKKAQKVFAGEHEGDFTPYLLFYQRQDSFNEASQMAGEIPDISKDLTKLNAQLAIIKNAIDQQGS